MKNIQNKIVLFLFIAFAFPQFGSSQDGLAEALEYEVNKIYPPISITKEQLNKEAHTLSDINEYYKSSWIKKYISVEVLASDNGRVVKAMSKNETLSNEQKDLMNRADVDTDISVKVRYIPENNLTHNDIKEINFIINIAPESDAKYSGGAEQLNQYLKEEAIDKIAGERFGEWTLAAVKFTITNEGQIIDAHIFETSKDKEIDELLLKTICNMPDWKPAEYANGTKVAQEFVLTVGNMQSCAINLLNIRRD